MGQAGLPDFMLRSVQGEYGYIKTKILSRILKSDKSLCVKVYMKRVHFVIARNEKEEKNAARLQFPFFWDFNF